MPTILGRAVPTRAKRRRKKRRKSAAGVEVSLAGGVQKHSPRRDPRGMFLPVMDSRTLSSWATSWTEVISAWRLLHFSCA